MLASDSNQSTYNEAVSATHKVDMNAIKKLYKMGLASSNHTQDTPEAAGGWNLAQITSLKAPIEFNNYYLVLFSELI